MSVNRLLYATHYTKLDLPATSSFAARTLSFPTQSASCEETIPQEDVLVLGKLGAAARMQKDVTTCKASLKLYLSDGYTLNAYGAAYDAGNTLADLRGEHLEQIREASLSGQNCRATLYSPKGVLRYDDDAGKGECKDNGGTVIGGFADDKDGCLSDTNQCTGMAGGPHNNKAACDADGGSWASNSFTPDPNTGLDNADPFFDERTDFIMYGLVSNISIDVSKGNFINIDLSLDGVGRPFLMYDYGSGYGDQYSVGGKTVYEAPTGGSALRGDTEVSPNMVCWPILPMTPNIIFGGRWPTDQGWEDNNRTANIAAVFAKMADPVIHVYQDLVVGDDAGIGDTPVDGWVPSSFKWSLDMPTESIDAMGKGKAPAGGGLASTGVGDYQYELDPAGAGLDPNQGDFDSTNIREKEAFFDRHRMFAKPPFKSTVTLEGVGLDVFPNDFETNAGSYLNTFYLGHLILRMPHNGSVAKGTHVQNGATSVTARSVNQAAGDISASYSITMESTDCLFQDRQSWGHDTHVAYCTNGYCANQGDCENAAASCNVTYNAGNPSTWNPAGTGNNRSAFDPFKIFTTAAGGKANV